MSPNSLSRIMPINRPHPAHVTRNQAQQSCGFPCQLIICCHYDREGGRLTTRILIRPQPGFYLMRLRSGAPLVPALIFQLCPMVIPQPMTVTGPHPDDWCRPLDRSPRFEARLDGKRVDIDRVWTARSLRRVSREEFEFRSGPLRRWARENRAPEERPYRPVDLGAIPPLF
jgi:hypothetical protein